MSNALDMDLEVRINDQAARNFSEIINRYLGPLDAGSIKKAVMSARTRAIQAGKALGAKLARQTYTARSAAIKRRFVAEKYSDGANVGLRFSGQPGLNLIHFMARPNTDRAPRPRQGVSVKVKRSGRRYVPQGKRPGGSKPFVMKTKSPDSDYGIFVRYGANDFEMLYGPSPIQALQAPERQEKIRERIEEIFERRLNHELDVRLQGLVS